MAVGKAASVAWLRRMHYAAFSARCVARMLITTSRRASTSCLLIRPSRSGLSRIARGPHACHHHSQKARRGACQWVANVFWRHLTGSCDVDQYQSCQSTKESGIVVNSRSYDWACPNCFKDAVRAHRRRRSWRHQQKGARSANSARASENSERNLWPGMFACDRQWMPQCWRLNPK